MGKGLAECVNDSLAALPAGADDVQDARGLVRRVQTDYYNVAAVFAVIAELRARRSSAGVSPRRQRVTIALMLKNDATSRYNSAPDARYSRGTNKVFAILSDRNRGI